MLAMMVTKAGPRSGLPSAQYWRQAIRQAGEGSGRVHPPWQPPSTTRWRSLSRMFRQAIKPGDSAVFTDSPSVREVI